MSETFEPNIRAALRTQLALVVDVPPLALEGQEYTPKVGEPFIRESLNFIFETPSSHGLISHRMVWNLSLNYPNGKGTRAAALMRGRIIESFPPGLKLATGGDALVVMENSRSGAVEDTDRLTLPLAIVLQAWTTG